jgi:mono/diheme cytochrome c family protein
MTQPRNLLGIILILFSAGAARAQQSPQDQVKRGEEVFTASCTGFCHGDKGTEGGGAPRLAGRGLSAQYIEKVVNYGIPGTPMPAWALKLPQNDTNAVVAYVESLNGLIRTANLGRSPVLSQEAANGRELFFDSIYDLRRCSNCHEVGGSGVSVASIAHVPTDLSALRNLSTPQVQTATENGKTFPAVVFAQVKEETRVYDLTAGLPVLRVFAPSAIKLTNGNSWQHSAAIKAYSDDELKAILGFLNALQEPQSGRTPDGNVKSGAAAVEH